MQWMNDHRDKKGKGMAPPCKKTTAILWFLKDRRHPALMKVQRVARSKSWKMLRSALERKALQAHPGLQVNWCFTVKVETQEEMGKSKYWIPKFTVGKRISEAEAQEMARMWEFAHPSFFGTKVEDVVSDVDEEGERPERFDDDIESDDPQDPGMEEKQDDLPF
jgi:hypothetical protein